MGFNLRALLRRLACSALQARLFAFAFLLAQASPSAFSPQALAKQNILPQLKFSHIAQSDLEGMGHINDIAQDTEGYLWFAAAKGLARYNGYELLPFRHKSGQSGGLPSNWVERLLITENGRLWATTREGYCRYDAALEKFDCAIIPVDRLTDKPTYDVLFEDSSQQLWLASSEGLFIIDRETLQPTRFEHAWLTEHTRGGGKFVTAIVEDHQGRLWLGHHDTGLSLYDPATGKGKHWQDGAAGLPSNKVRTLFIDNHQRLWIGTQGAGIALFDLNKHQAERFIHNPLEKADTVWDIHQDRRGLIWIGDGTGVHVVSPIDMSVESHRYIEGKPLSPGNFVVRSLFEDNRGGIWIGYFPSGIDRVDEQGSQFVTYRHDPRDSDSLPDGGVLSTLEDKKGNIWVGAGFGLGYFDRTTSIFHHFSHDPNDPTTLSGSTILDMAYGQNEELWLGVWDRGLNRRDPQTGEFSHYLPVAGEPNSLLGREPWGLLYDSQNRLWVASERGVSRYRPETDDFEHYLPNGRDGKQVDALYTRFIYEDRDGRIWVASFAGLYLLDPQSGEFTAYRHDPNNINSISSNMVSTLFEDSEGRFWVGTDGAGVNLMDRTTGHFTRFGEEHGLPDQSVSSIIEDPAGQIWLATYQGLVVFSETQGVINHYTRGHGLPGNLFNRHSGSRLSSGELAFGSSEGLVIFRPSQLISNWQPPSLVLSELRVFNRVIKPNDETQILSKDINLTEHIVLNHEQSVFSVSFAALDYRSPEDNTYAYRLVGFEKEWNWVDKQRSAIYTNLDAGEYQLEVKAANSAGVWNNTPKKLRITVIPPIWLTSWAKTAYIIIALGILLRLYYVQRQRLESARQKLESERELVTKLREVERMKDNINRELDQKVAQRTLELNREKELLLAAHEELATLNEKLESMTVTDQLTGLNNRRYLDQFIHEDIALVQRQFAHGIPKENTSGLVFVILDLDDFKAVNDTYGHDAGDALLIQLADVLKTVLRQSDYIVRWGGEEFVVVMRHLKREDVEISVERLRAAIANTPFDIGRGEPLHKTASIGFATYPFHPMHVDALSWEQVIGIADRALYCTKKSGKNGWVGIASKDMSCRKGEVVDLAYEAHLIQQLNDDKLKVVTNLDNTSLNWQ
ncbi:MAG TPA: two-component regulator propeller domain-containing protein [Marinagarivorans sp.]